MRRELTPLLGKLPWLLTPDSRNLIEFMAELSIVVHCHHAGLPGFAGRTSSLWEGILVEQLRLKELRGWWVERRVVQNSVKRALVRRMWKTALFTERQGLRHFVNLGLYYPAELFGSLRTALPGLSDGHGMTELVRESLIQSLGTIRALHFDEVDVFLTGVDPALPLLPVPYSDELNALPRYLLSVGVYNNAVHMALRYRVSRRDLLMDGMYTLASARNESSFLNQVATHFLHTLQAADYRMERWTEPD